MQKNYAYLFEGAVFFQYYKNIFFILLCVIVNNRKNFFSPTIRIQFFLKSTIEAGIIERFNFVVCKFYAHFKA